MGPKSAPDGFLRNPKEDRTVRNDRINEVRTVPRAKALQNLRLPERFLRLKEEQQAGALVALQIVLGGWVSTNYAVLACSSFPQCQGQWWPEMDWTGGFELWRATYPAETAQGTAE